MKKIVGVLREHELKLKTILLTHGHPDHAAGAGPLSDATGAPVFIHPLDAEALAGRKNLLLGLQAGVMATRPKQVQEVVEGDEFRAGSLCLRTLETPGHTRGGVSFYLPGHLFNGDFIFAGSIGRTDLRAADRCRRCWTRYSRRYGTCPMIPSSTRGMARRPPSGEEKASNPYLSGLGRRRSS